MSRVKSRQSAVKIIKWNISKRFDGGADVYTGNGVHLLAGHARSVPRWWSMTLTLTLCPESESSNELEAFKSNFRPDTKLAFSEIMAAIAGYVKDNYTVAQIERVVSGEIVAAVCATKPK